MFRSLRPPCAAFFRFFILFNYKMKVNVFITGKNVYNFMRSI
ncbi:hypothetical protein D2M30_3109 [Bacillus amyloliquefaciens]|nr:hypothetical protein D2M30_3109 [Bacillus amyloliquefaciens]